MITVELSGLSFKAFHGIFEEERILGNDYIIDAALCFHEGDEIITQIERTINYVTVYEIIKTQMNNPTPLLETLVMKIGNEIHQIFPYLKTLTITLKKMHPPISGMQGCATVIWHKEF